MSDTTLQIREVWVDQQGQTVEPTHCIEFYRAWSKGEIHRELWPDPRTESFAQVFTQFLQYMEQYSLAGLVLNHVLVQEQNKHHHYKSIGVNDTGFIAADWPDAHKIVLARLVSGVLVPDNTDVMRLLLEKVHQDNVAESSTISLTSLAHVRNSIWKWRLVARKLLVTASAVHELMVDLDSAELTVAPAFQKIFGLELFCTGGPADQTWVHGTPCILVLGNDVGVRAMRKPWTLEEQNGSLAVSCEKADEIIAPRGIGMLKFLYVFPNGGFVRVRPGIYETPTCEKCGSMKNRKNGLTKWKCPVCQPGNKESEEEEIAQASAPFLSSIPWWRR